MAVELVDVLVRDVAPPNDGVAGVQVFVYDSTGTTLITSGITDGTGHVQFMLPGTAAPSPTRYQLRTYKPEVSSPQPLYIDVFSPASGSPTGTNNFRIDVTLFVLPPAVDPRLCRLSGHIFWPDGTPHRAVDIHFISRFNPLVVDGIGINGERRACRTDKDGYVQIDLYRKGCYRVVMQGHENAGRSIYIPDLASANINFVLFPRVMAVVFDPAPPWSLAVGTELSIGVEVQLTSGYTIDGTAQEDVLYSLPVGDITAALQVLDDRLLLRGTSPGTSHLNLERIDKSLAYVPDDAITGDGALFTVV